MLSSHLGRKTRRGDKMDPCIGDEDQIVPVLRGRSLSVKWYAVKS